MSDARYTLGIAATVAAAVGVWLFAGRPSVEREPGPGAGSAPIAEMLSPAPIPPEHMPAPLGDRGIREPDPSVPAPSPTAAFCAEENWSRLQGVVSPGEDGTLRVDPAVWGRTLASSRAGLASFASTCRHGGEAVRIVAADTGALLATYDPTTGLRPHPAP